jgi:hypothetical protein
MNPVANTPTVAASTMRPFFRFLLWGLVLTAGCATGVKGVVRHYEVGPWFKVGLTLLPLLPFGYALYRYARDTRGRSDELEQRISADAVAAGFFIFFIGVIAVDLLQTGGVLGDYAWTKNRLLGAMLVALLLGWGWSARRFR